MSPDIIGLGEVVVDWVATVDHFPEPDEKIDSISQDLFSGGVTANYSVAAARLGANIAFIGAVGEDDYGEFLKKDFVNEKVNLKGLVTKKSEKTPVNFIFVVKDSGEKVIIQSPYMHTTKPDISDLDKDLIKSAKLIHTTGIYPKLTEKAFQIARMNNILISFDLEKQIAIRGEIQLRPLLEQVDILLPNKMGAMELTQTNSPEEAAKKFLNWGIKLVVITLGKEGAVAFTKNEKIQVPSFPINPIDTTGAGDTFCGAFTYCYVIKKQSLRNALYFANSAAALKCMKLGARTGMPSWEDVMNHLASNDIEFN